MRPTRGLLCDPQTSGGLLIAVAGGQASDVLQLAQAAGFTAAAVIGSLQEGATRISVKQRAC
jgi:selenide,water dikinase